jgi:protein TonB
VTRASLLYFASFGAHALMAVGVVSMKGARKTEDISVAVIEKAKSEPKKDAPPPPPPPPVEPPKAEAKARTAPKAAVAKPAAEAPAPAAGAAPGGDVPDFGLSLGGGTGGGGLAVPVAAAHAGPAAAEAVHVTKKLLGAPAPARTDACADEDHPPTKPKVVSISQPAYTEDARAASIAGKVRVELTVDTTGHVSSARVLEGLGHGLDEAALAAARAATFEPGTRCGKPAPATFVIAMRFAL